MRSAFHRAACCALLVGLLPAGCASVPGVLELDGHSMGTGWSVKAVASEAERALLAGRIDARLAALVAEMSAWEPDSELTRFNHAEPGHVMGFSPDLCAVLGHALELARDTNGAYDPTIGALASLWGFGPQARPLDRPPAAEDIDRAREQVGWRKLDFDAATCRATQPGGVLLDVSSLGPGYAVDQIAAELDALGIKDYLAELGGEMRAHGLRPDGHPWRVAIERPDDAGARDVVVALRDGALGTSGDYRSGFVHEGRRYSHTLDPRSGEPVAHALAAVTVLADSAMSADAMAAALMVLGPEEGRDFATSRGVAAVFTVRETNGYARRFTPAFEDHLDP